MASQSFSAVGTSNVGASEAQDILTSLPPEILLKIISQLPSKNNLALVQSSRSLRNFVKINASRICNEAIRTRFPLEAALLESELEAGWLVPTNNRVSAQERNLQEFHFGDNLSWIWRITPGGRPAKVLPFSLLGEVKPTDEMHLKLSSPGPQYLYALEQGLLVVGMGSFQCHICHRPMEAVVGGQRYFFDLQDWLKFEPYPRRPRSLWGFLERFNKVQLYVRDQKKLMRPGNSMWKFPRELVWFYGVERLRFVKDEEQRNDDDWRNMPMLLWE